MLPFFIMQRSFCADHIAFSLQIFPPFHLCSLPQNLNLKNDIIWAPLFSTFNCVLLMERTGKKKEEGLGEGYQYFFLYFPLLAMLFAVTMFLSYDHISYVKVPLPLLQYFFFFFEYQQHPSLSCPFRSQLITALDYCQSLGSPSSLAGYPYLLLSVNNNFVELSPINPLNGPSDFYQC